MIAKETWAFLMILYSTFSYWWPSTFRRLAICRRSDDHGSCIRRLHALDKVIHVYRWLSARLQYLQWRYCSLTLSHRYQRCRFVHNPPSICWYKFSEQPCCVLSHFPVRNVNGCFCNLKILHGYFCYAYQSFYINHEGRQHVVCSIWYNNNGFNSDIEVSFSK